MGCFFFACFLELVWIRNEQSGHVRLYFWPLAKAQLWRKSWRIFAQSMGRCYLCARQRIELWGTQDIMWLHMIAYVANKQRKAELCKAYRAMRSCPTLLGSPSNMDHCLMKLPHARCLRYVGWILDFSFELCCCCQVGASMGGFGVARLGYARYAIHRSGIWNNGTVGHSACAHVPTFKKRKSIKIGGQKCNPWASWAKDYQRSFLVDFASQLDELPMIFHISEALLHGGPLADGVVAFNPQVRGLGFGTCYRWKNEWNMHGSEYK